MYGNNYGYYNPTKNIGVPTQPISNQYIQQPTQMPMNNYIQQPMQQPMPNIQSGLQGKIVDNADVVRATDIPLDGSVSYFPLTDGSAIVTKKLGMNGSSEIVIYKPIIEVTKDNETKEENKQKYITESYLNEKIEKLDNSDILNNLLDEMKGLKQEIKDFKNKSKEKEK